MFCVPYKTINQICNHPSIFYEPTSVLKQYNRQFNMFTRLASNRSPQHQNSDFNKKKVLLPASVFNKPDKDRSLTRQFTNDQNRSLTPQQKLKFNLQSCRSKPLLTANKFLDFDEGINKSVLKKSYLQNSKVMKDDRFQNQKEQYNWKEEIRQIKDIKNRNMLRDMFQKNEDKYQQFYEIKEGFEVQQRRVVHSFNKQKKKIEQFYNQIINTIMKHKQGIISVLNHEQQKVTTMLRNGGYKIELSLDNLFSLQNEIIQNLPFLQKYSQEKFKDRITSFKNTQDQICIDASLAKIKFSNVSVSTSQEHYIKKKLIDLLQSCVVIDSTKTNRKNEGIQNIGSNINSIQSLNELRNNQNRDIKYNQKVNLLEKYIYGQSAGQSQSEMLLSKKD